MRGLARSDRPELLDTFLVSGVVTVLVIRLFLASTGYPQLGGRGLHIAHVLWGGLGMVIAIYLVLVFLSPRARRLAALVGGVGLGAFIDELGKFLTSDNNYFFRPTAALVYAVFVVLFLAGRQALRYRKLSPAEYLVNALEVTKDLATGTLTEAERARGFMMLERSDESLPLVAELKREFLAAEVPDDSPSLTRRLRKRVARAYAAVAGSTWFGRALATVFILQAAGAILGAALSATIVAGSVLGVPEARSALVRAGGGSTLTSWLQLGAAAASSVFVVRGVLALRRSRRAAYRSFEVSVLLDLLLSQPLGLLDNGFEGFGSVLFDLALLGTLRFMQAQERRGAVGPPAGLQRPREARAG